MAYPVLLKSWTDPRTQATYPNAAHIISDFAPKLLQDDTMSPPLVVEIATYVTEAVARHALNPANINTRAEPLRTQRYRFPRAQALDVFGIQPNGTPVSTNPIREMYDLVKAHPDFAGATETG